MAAGDDAPRLPFETAEEFRAWLSEHYADDDGMWLVLAKKGSGIPTVSYDEAVEIALCFGWIDGPSRSLDATRYLQRFTPRRARSRWSKINVGKAEALIAAGLMAPPGQAEIDRAKADGRWAAAYEPSSTATVPPELQAALDAHPVAAEAFTKITAASRFAMIYRVSEGKRAETRVRNADKFVAMLAAGEEPYPRDTKNPKLT